MVDDGLKSLAPHLQSWVKTHLIQPRPIRLFRNTEGTSPRDLWLVTDHNGEHDSSYRIVYDDRDQVFGLECTLDSGVEWYMGDYGSFSETVENM